MSPDELSQDEIDSLLSDSDQSAGDEEGTVSSEQKAGGTGTDEGEKENASKVSGQRSPESSENASAVSLPSLDGGEGSGPEVDIEDLLQDVDLDVKIELGRAVMTVEDIIKLNAGSVVELNKLAGDPVDILVNEQMVAKGEVLVLNDAFCIRITEIISKKEKLYRNM